jgi:hypothetical protein
MTLPANAGENSILLGPEVLLQAISASRNEMPSGPEVAISVAMLLVSPLTISDALVTVITNSFTTVKVAAGLVLFAEEAVILAVPNAMAVASPLASTVVTDGLPEAQVKDTPKIVLLFASFAVATNC